MNDRSPPHRPDGSPAPVLVYGATGRTGQRVCAALLERDVPVLAVGRSAEKVRALASALARPVEMGAASLDDGQELCRLAERCSVIVNCAGPFALHGRSLQDVALSVRRHALDLAGEPAFVQATFGRDGEARERGVALVSGIGFDVVPTDALATLLADAVGGEVRSARVAYSALDAGATDGIAETILRGLLEGGFAWSDGALRSEPLGARSWRVSFPPPLKTSVCRSTPWGDIVSLPRSTGAREARAFLPRQTFSPKVARAILRLLQCSLSEERFGKLLVRARDSLVKRNPTVVERGGLLGAVVEIRGEHAVKRGWIRVREGFAAQAAATCARLAAQPTFHAVGALTPSRAFGALPLLQELMPYGLEWGVDEA